MKINTGTVQYRDSQGKLWEAKSYLDDETGEVTTETLSICESPNGPCSGFDNLPEDCPVRNGEPCPIGIVPTQPQE